MFHKGIQTGQSSDPDCQNWQTDTKTVPFTYLYVPH